MSVIYVTKVLLGNGVFKFSNFKVLAYTIDEHLYGDRVKCILSYIDVELVDTKIVIVTNSYFHGAHHSEFPFQHSCIV